MNKKLLLTVASTTPFTAFGGGVGKEIKKFGRSIDPTNKNSEVRKAG